MDTDALKVPFISLEDAAKKMADAHNRVHEVIAQHAADAAASRREAHDALHALRLSQGATYKGGESQ